MKINLSTIPHKPGIYQFKDNHGNLLYIGKAIDLKKRVSSYFHKSSELTPHKQQMIPRIKHLEYIITSSETEALLLESGLIKKHQPPYNIDLKDDKNFLYIKITTSEDFPRVFTVRRLTKDHEVYFGPYVSAGPVRDTLRTLRQLFPHRNFPKPANARQLSFLVKRYPQLLGPADNNEYRQNIQRIIKFLKGQYEEIAKELNNKMSLASQRQQYEKAAQLRDKILSINRLMEKQKVISTKHENQDIISLSREDNLGAINVFNVRNGKLILKQNFLVRNIHGQKGPEIFQAFMEQYYPQVTDLPREVLVAEKPTEPEIIAKTFKVRLIVPQKGLKRQYLNLGEENAAAYLYQQKTSWEKNEEKNLVVLRELQKHLSLKKMPRRIEVFDISNIQGANAVGSMIVFTNGQPDKKWYRKFKIKTVAGSNDTAMMAEVVSRRFGHFTNKKNDWPKPDLIILDGGKGQLSTVLKKVKLKLPIIALAKKEEDIYLPGKKTPINLPPDSPSFFLVQRMRDEAHRFAINFFRKTHGRALQKSKLDEFPGLGKIKKSRLIKRFGSARAVLDSPVHELAAVIGDKLAKQIKQSL